MFLSTLDLIYRVSKRKVMNRSQKTSRVEIPVPPASSTTEFTEVRHAQADAADAIRRRAYELYEERGKEDGYPGED